MVSAHRRPVPPHRGRSYRDGSGPPWARATGSTTAIKPVIGLLPEWPLPLPRVLASGIRQAGAGSQDRPLSQTRGLTREGSGDSCGWGVHGRVVRGGRFQCGGPRLTRFNQRGRSHLDHPVDPSSLLGRERRFTGVIGHHERVEGGGDPKEKRETKTSNVALCTATQPRGHTSAAHAYDLRPALLHLTGRHAQAPPRSLTWVNLSG